MRHQELPRFGNQRRLRKNKSGFVAYFSLPPNNVRSLQGVKVASEQKKTTERLCTLPATGRFHRAYKNCESFAYPLTLKSHRSSSLLVHRSARQGQCLQLTWERVGRTGLTSTAINTKITGIARILNDKILYLYNLSSHGFCYSKPIY